MVIGGLHSSCLPTCTEIRFEEPALNFQKVRSRPLSFIGTEGKDRCLHSFGSVSQDLTRRVRDCRHKDLLGGFKPISVSSLPHESLAQFLQS
jgi:hypothetical protein